MKSSFRSMKSFSGAISVLGEPIKDMGFDFGVEMNKFADGKIDGFVVPVKGVNQRGKLHFWAENRDEKWHITRAELELDKDPDRRLLLRKVE